MPDDSAKLTLTLHPNIAEIDPADWDACAGEANPFVSHAFMSAMEDSGSETSTRSQGAPGPRSLPSQKGSRSTARAKRDCCGQ